MKPANMSKQVLGIRKKLPLKTKWAELNKTHSTTKWNNKRPSHEGVGRRKVAVKIIIK